MGKKYTGYAELITYSILSGTVGIFVKLTQNLNIFSIIFLRACIATIFIFIVIFLIKKFKELSIIHPWKTLSVGIFQGLSILLYFEAILRTSISNAVLLLYTAPIFSAVLAKYFLKEKIKKNTIIGILIVITGIILILQPGTFTFKLNETIGNLMGLGAGFFYAAMALTAKPIMKDKSGYYVTFWQYLIMTLMFGLFIDIRSTSVLFENWWQLSIIGIVCTGIAFILFMEGIKKVKVQKIFIITALEPLTGILLGSILLKEIPSFLTIIGAGLILFGVYKTTHNNIKS